MTRLQSVVRHGRSGALAFFLVQAAASGTSFLIWALASHLLPPAAQVPAATALGWGMVLYLPLTLGLPYLLPNLHRGDQDPIAAELVVRTLTGIATGAAVLGVALAVVGALTGAPAAPLALSLALAGGIVLSITCQQVARIRRRLRIMLVAASANLLLPLGWLGAEILTRDAAASAVFACGLFLAYCLATARSLGVRRRGRPDLAALRPMLRRSAPLVPHLLAFGVLAQGIRFTAGLTETSAAAMLQAHFVMTFLGMGMTVISAVQGIVSVDVQLARAEDLHRALRRSAAALTGAGVITSAVVVGVYASPLRGLFAGAAAPDPLLLTALALPMPLQCAYFAVNNLYLRAERTLELAAASGLTAVLFVAAELLLRPATPALALLVYDVTLAALPALLLGRLIATRARSAGAAGLAPVPA